MSNVLIGHANGDEKGGSTGGQPGDQTGKELCIQPWYNSGSGWNMVFRPRSAALAERMASACEWLCNSNLVGYDQSQRNTLYNELEKLNWNYTKLTTKCETDCSAFMGTCAKIAGSNVERCYGNCCYTGNQKDLFMKTGDFILLTDSKYLTSSNYLQRGDVLMRHNPANGSGHTAMVLSNGPYANGAIVSPSSSSKIPTINPFLMPIFNLKRGAKSQGVKWIQYNLYKAGYGIGSYDDFVDGEFGINTDACVKRFQRDHNLEVDGIVGPQTRAALKKVK